MQCLLCICLSPFIFTAIYTGFFFLLYSVDCGKKLCGSLDGLFQIYQRAVTGEGTFKVAAEDSLHLVEALRYYCYLGSSKLYVDCDELYTF